MKLNIKKLAKNPYAIAGAVIIVGSIIYVLTKKPKIKAAEEGNDEDETFSYDALPSIQFPIKIRATGKQVADVQEALNRKFAANLKVDGVMGESTLAALCDNIWKTCYTQAQARIYSLDSGEYYKLIR